jgi:hypothetical protein
MAGRVCGTARPAIARCATCLASDESGRVTAFDHKVDGGATSR